jgi:hypothetical protein
MAAPTMSELRAMSIDDVIARYDHAAETADGGLTFYREEVARRDAAEQTSKIVDLTAQIVTLTYVITGLTFVTAVAAVVVLIQGN